MAPGYDYFDFSVKFLCVMYIIEFYIKSRQYKIHQAQSTQSFFSQIPRKNDFLKFQRYQQNSIHFRLIKLSFDLALTLFFYFAVAAFYRQAKEAAMAMWPQGGRQNREALLVATVFLAELILISDLIDLPFALYKTYVVELQHGFGNMPTLADFCSDRVLCLKYGVALPVLGIFVVILNQLKENFPFYLYLSFLFFKVANMVLFPVLIQPCMHKVIDLPLGTTHSAIMHLSARLKYPLGQIYTVDAPQKSGEQILQLYGLCGNRKIFINEKIKEKCSTKEIVALFVHELGHWRSNHFFVSFVITEIITAVVFYMMRLFLFSNDLYESFGLEEQPLFVGALLFFFIFDPIWRLKKFFTNLYVWQFEKDADKFAAKLGYAKDLTEALKKLHNDYEIEMVVDPLYALYHYDRLPVIERIKLLAKKPKKK